VTPGESLPISPISSLDFGDGEMIRRSRASTVLTRMIAGNRPKVVQRAHHIPQRSPVNEVGHDVDDARLIAVVANLQNRRMVDRRRPVGEERGERLPHGSFRSATMSA
jgi:hypothetical protein